jgi:hypothetical protein
VTVNPGYRFPVSRRILFAVMALSLSTAAPVLGDSVSFRLDQLSWLAGSWAADSAGTRIEEHWMTPRGGMMVGMHRDVVRGRAVSFEFFRIVEDSSGIAYLTSPGGRPAIRFSLKEMAKQRVVFENSTHDFPQRILYWIDAQGQLRARIEGTFQGKASAEEWAWKRDGLTGGAQAD